MSNSGKEKYELGLFVHHDGSFTSRLFKLTAGLALPTLAVDPPELKKDGQFSADCSLFNFYDDFLFVSV
jgi:hypothetical protein